MLNLSLGRWIKHIRVFSVKFFKISSFEAYFGVKCVLLRVFMMQLCVMLRISMFDFMPSL